MNWVKKRKLPAIKAIQHEGHLCIELKDLWIALYNSFNSVQIREINIHILDKIPNKPMRSWNSFSKQELIDAIEKCNNLSVLGLDKLIWNYIKSIIKNKDYIFKLINIANTCIDLGHWLSHFKTSITIVISKPNKSTVTITRP